MKQTSICGRATAFCALTLAATSGGGASSDAGSSSVIGRGDVKLQGIGQRGAVAAVFGEGQQLYDEGCALSTGLMLCAAAGTDGYAREQDFQSTPGSDATTTQLARALGTGTEHVAPRLVSAEAQGPPEGGVGVAADTGRHTNTRERGFASDANGDGKKQTGDGTSSKSAPGGRRVLWRGIGHARRQRSHATHPDSMMLLAGEKSVPKDDAKATAAASAPNIAGSPDGRGAVVGSQPKHDGKETGRPAGAQPQSFFRPFCRPTFAQIPPSSSIPHHTPPPVQVEAQVATGTTEGSTGAAATAQRMTHGDVVDTSGGELGRCGATCGICQNGASRPHGDGVPLEPHPQWNAQGLYQQADPPRPRCRMGMTPQGYTGIDDAGARGTAVVAVAVKKFAATLVPDMLQAAKFLAAAGIVYRMMRRLAAAAHSVRPAELQQWEERGDRSGGGSGRERGGKAGDELRMAREYLLMQASSMHVPADVVASLDEYELEVAADLVDCDRLDVTFEDIAGMESVKQSLQEIVSEPLDFPPDLYPARLIKPCSGILIYGPPGCGKTLLAKAVAKQSGAAFINVKASTLMRRSGGDSAGAGRVGRVGVRGHGSGGGAGARVGHSSVMVRALFSLAQKIQPCIIFFDEADGLCLKREEGDSGADREVMTELMQLWDDLSCAGQDRVVVLAATNRPWDLDPAVQVGLPDRKMRKAVLMKALEDVEVEEGFDWRELAVNTEGYSCGDVVELCREAVRGPLREAMERNRRRAARRQNHGFRQTRFQQQQQQQRQQQQQHRRKDGQQNRRRRHRGNWQSDLDPRGSSETIETEVAPLPSVRMRPLRMSDMTAAQRRVVPAFWQAEAYRATYDGYMGSLMEHARQNWSR